MLSTSLLYMKGDNHMSCRRLLVLAVTATLLSTLSPSIVKAGPMIRKIDPADMKFIMPVQDIRPGMKGYGQTVFLGTKIEKFDVEVLGVMKKVNSGQDMILVKMVGGPMTKRGANLIQGMSGSPIYINGKLIGAFSMGEAFVKEPLGMVTPIASMLDAWDPSLPAKPSSFYSYSTSNIGKPINLSGQNFGKIVIDNSDAGRGAYDAGTLVFRPLSMPFSISGISPRVLSMFQEPLRQLNLTPAVGVGGVYDNPNQNVDLVAGAGIGVSLMTGDLDMTGIGTITYRRGNKILAFGHPMLGIGALEAPLTSAYVYGVTPSVMVSSKMAGPMKIVGKLEQDRPWSIAGELGKTANLIPLTVHISDKSLGRKRDFDVRVANHPLLSPLLMLMASAESISEMRPTPTDAVAKVKFEVVADEVGTITRENTFFDPTSIESSAVSELQQVLSMMRSNPFHPVAIRKVTMWVELDTNHPTAKLERVFLKDNKFEPGDTVEVGAVLKPFNGDRVTKTFSIKLPKNMPSGQMALQIGPPQSSSGLIGALLGMMDESGSGAMYSSGGAQPMSTMDNLQQQVKKFLERDKNNELSARIIYPRAVPAVSGEKLTSLPPSILDVMKSPRSTPLGSDREEIKQIIPTDWVLSGSQRLLITVRKIDKSDKKSGANKGSEGPGMPPSGASPGMPPGMDDMGEGMDDMETEATSFMTPAASVSSITETYLGTEVNASPAVADADAKSPKSDVKSTAAAPANAETSKENPTDKDEEKKPAAQVTEKPVVRMPTTWKQTTKADFGTGTSKNAVITTGDQLEASDYISRLAEFTETYTWSVLPDGHGNVYAGTGNHGTVYKISSDGKISVFYKSSELEIHCLAMDAAGNIYAGSSPHGIIYKIDANGDAVQFFDAPEKYIVAMKFDSKGNLYAATGDQCKVYKITPEGKASVALETSENHALTLAVDSSDNVYVGTGLNGLIYKINSTGEVSSLFDAAEDSITALAINSKGVIYAGTAPKGVIYKLTPGATPKTVYDKAGTAIMGISIDKADNVYAVNSTNMFKIMSDDTVGTFDNKLDLQFLCSTIRDDQLYVGTSNVGAVYLADLTKPVEGTYESVTHDCSLTSRWGTMDWVTDLPTGTSISVQTRTGNSSEPDATWSAWSSPITSAGSKITSPTGRYIQYRATLMSGNSTDIPKLKELSISYLPDNQAPKVTINAPKGGEKWAKKQTIRWSGTDPDKDTLTYDLFYSTDNGKNWMPLKDKMDTEAKPDKEKPVDDSDKAIVIKATVASTSAGAPDQKQMMDAMNAELAKHPEIPKEIKDKMMSDAPSVSVDESEDISFDEKPSTPSEKPGATKKTSFAWDTSKAKDGTYMVKVITSDRLSNPVGALTGEAIAGPITIVNKLPVVTILSKTINIQPDRTVRMQGLSSQSLVGIAGVQYRIDSTGDWAAAAADDGIYDSQYEGFTITTQPLDKGDHTIEVKAIDQAGNAATTSAKVKIN